MKLQIERLQKVLTRKRRSNRSRFEVLEAAHGAYLAKDQHDEPAILIPIREAFDGVNREFGPVCLDFFDQLQFNLGKRSWSQPAISISCTDPSKLYVFIVMSIDIIRVANGKAKLPTAEQVAAAVSPWEVLFRRPSRLSQAKQRGLWAELKVILSATSVDRAFKAWRGIDGHATDFFSSGVSIEVKASERQLTHFFSQSQIEFGLSHPQSYILSCHMSEDPKGESLPLLVSQLISKVGDPVELEKRLLSYGYSHVHARFYQKLYSLVGSPRLFRVSDVPRIKSYDSKISLIRYRVSLDPKTALMPSEQRKLIGRIFGR